MKLPAKVEYGALAMLALAASCAAGQRLQIKRIADDHHIPPQFLVQIFQDLKRAGLVESLRGASGGYRLARPPEEITLADIVAALECTSAGISSSHEPSPLEQTLAQAWHTADEAHAAHLESVTLADLVERAASEANWVI